MTRRLTGSTQQVAQSTAPQPDRDATPSEKPQQVMGRRLPYEAAETTTVGQSKRLPTTTASSAAPAFTPVQPPAYSPVPQPAPVAPMPKVTATATTETPAPTTPAPTTGGGWSTDASGQAVSSSGWALQEGYYLGDDGNVYADSTHPMWAELAVTGMPVHGIYQDPVTFNNWTVLRYPNGKIETMDPYGTKTEGYNIPTGFTNVNDVIPATDPAATPAPAPTETVPAPAPEAPVIDPYQATLWATPAQGWDPSYGQPWLLNVWDPSINGFTNVYAQPDDFRWTYGEPPSFANAGYVWDDSVAGYLPTTTTPTTTTPAPEPAAATPPPAPTTNAVTTPPAFEAGSQGATGLADGSIQIVGQTSDGWYVDQNGQYYSPQGWSLESTYTLSTGGVTSNPTPGVLTPPVVTGAAPVTTPIPEPTTAGTTTAKPTATTTPAAPAPAAPTAPAVVSPTTTMSAKTTTPIPTTPGATIPAPDLTPTTPSTPLVPVALPPTPAPATPSTTPPVETPPPTEDPTDSSEWFADMPEYEAGMAALDDALAGALSSLGIAEAEIPATLELTKQRLLLSELESLRQTDESLNARGIYNSGIRTNDRAMVNLSYDQQEEDASIEAAKGLAEIAAAKTQAYSDYSKGISDLLLALAGLKASSADGDDGSSVDEEEEADSGDEDSSSGAGDGKDDGKDGKDGKGDDSDDFPAPTLNQVTYDPLGMFSAGSNPLIHTVPTNPLIEPVKKTTTTRRL